MSVRHDPARDLARSPARGPAPGSARGCPRRARPARGARPWRLIAWLAIACGIGAGAQPVDASDDRLVVGEIPCSRIDQVVLEGEQAGEFGWALDAAALDARGQADPADGRCLGTTGIALLTRRVQNEVIRRGFITTRVLVAPQDLGGGTLRLSVVPGRWRQVRFQGEAPDRATAWNAMPGRAGDLLNLRAIEQALENFRRLPTAEADITIEPAQQVPGTPRVRPGESDLVVTWNQDRPLRLALALDDGGTPAVGRYQGSLTLSHDHWWTLNDLFHLTLARDLGGHPTARGTRGHVLHYSLPLGWWLVGLTRSRHRDHQAVAGAQQTYVYSGDSDTGDLRLSRVAGRDAAGKSTLSLRGWWRASRNFIDGTEVEVQRRRTAGWELGAGHRRHLGDGGLDLAVAWRRGTGAWQALDAPEDAFGEGASRPRVATADVAVAMPLGPPAAALRWDAAWRGQWTRQALTPPDRFAIGGRHSVRGFSGHRVLSAARGWWLRQEVAWRHQAHHLAFLALDHGEVGGAGSLPLAGRRLTGAVLGVRGDHGPLAYEAFVGGPVRQPAGFAATRRVTGFSLTASF